MTSLLPAVDTSTTAWPPSNHESTVKYWTATFDTLSSQILETLRVRILRYMREVYGSNTADPTTSAFPAVSQVEHMRMADWYVEAVLRNAATQFARDRLYLSVLQSALTATPEPHRSSDVNSGISSVCQEAFPTRDQDTPEGGLSRVAQLATLGPDWDSYGAYAPTHEAVNAAYILLVRLELQATEQVREHTQPFAVSPTPSGGVQLDWRGAIEEVQVDIDPEGRYGYLHITGSGADRTFQERGNVSLEDILCLISTVSATATNGRE
jgi:hypothetical protein